MQIDRAYGGRTTRRRRMAPAVAAAPVPSRVIDQGSARTYRTFEVPNPTKADGTWEVDWERAHADAQKTLDAIDFSKRDIVIWAPGTSNHGPHPAFEAAIAEAYRGEGSNLVALEYEATWHLRRSLPTGIATMRLVLEGINARGGDHRVLLSGESQGAWIIGEVLADPAVSSIVDRAVLLGHPRLAKHQYNAGQDARVRVINHAGDQVALPIRGSATDGLDAMLAIRTLDMSKAGALVRAITANPDHGVKMLANIIFALPFVKSLLKNPHVYDGEMTRAVEYLRHGSLPMSQEFAQIAHLTATTGALADPAHGDDAHRRLERTAAIAAYASLRAA
ncbi:MAG: Cutinase [Thermoleophilia bacterium]|nr:Cutinase [Thermoleophilia bacterium]